MRKADLMGAALVVMTAGGVSAAPGDKANAQMKDRDGNTVGTIVLTETPHGVLLLGEISALPPGAHGLHIHAVGTCEPPFTSAGPHFNPEGKKHGFHDAAGPHAGDLPNLYASPDRKATVDAIAVGVSLSSGPRNILDQDGASIVIHARADDYRTDPAGDSGDRIVCGVVDRRS